MSDKYDVIVIGGGPAGYIAAIRAAQLGKKVLLIEKDKLGGTCLNRGCIPTKAIIASINLYNKLPLLKRYGLSACDIKIDMKAVIERKDRIVARLCRGVEHLLKQNKVEVVFGEGKLIDQENITVGSQNFATRKIIIATGSSPIELPGMPFDGKQFFSSSDVLGWTDIPKALDIVGGGVIGVEFAYIYSSLGTEINLYEALPALLNGMDKDLSKSAEDLLKRKRVNLKLDTPFKKEMSCGRSLICVGRKPNKINLPATKDIVYAGDASGGIMLAHAAYEQGMLAAEGKSWDQKNIPMAVYTHPEIGSVGVTEKEAGDRAAVSKFPLSALGYANAIGETEGFVKIVADKNSEELLGIHIFGSGASDLLSAATLAVKKGLKAGELGSIFQAHPSLGEGLQEAALGIVKKSLHSMP
ncbi:MAG: FAD-dependent oxidoreductase [Candidatus Margulisiibacteriota bacterium]|nr:FAD-dependent oxidoreductase [Candidatus Margulisiibacteriota bacterium]